MSFAIRPYHPSDMAALYRICLGTGKDGGDASHDVHAPDILGHLFAAPYAAYEPDLCFILTHGGDPCGYVLGARDTAAFGALCEREWFPILRQRYPIPAEDDTSLTAKWFRSIHADHHHDGTDLDLYPAHLHIDLLPVAQGKGWGYKMIDTFVARLRELGVPGVHLGVSKRNERAVGFYARAGFHIVQEYPWGYRYGMKLL
jgi:ribosomal protein S18 acetylase RimI-like enzyme